MRAKTTTSGLDVVVTHHLMDAAGDVLKAMTNGSATWFDTWPCAADDFNLTLAS